MIDLIAKLIQKGVAYQNGGSVYYRIEKFPDYGKLSKKKLDQNIAGASKRLDVDEYDRGQISDFALWKGAKEGEPSWDSPWGKGRPGWHIECSAMSMKYLGETFDIHAGGEDLIFPHHENEIAQSEAATGKKFVNTWLHCKFLLVNGEKMSKSKGNFYTLRDLLAKGHDPMAIRYALLSTHYRKPLNFTLQGLTEASEIIRKMDDCYYQCLAERKKADKGGYDAGYDRGIIEESWNEIKKWMSDDLNIAGVLADVFFHINELNSSLPRKNHQALDMWLDYF
jgi:cysteinyl-tRNA synthetase